MVTATLDTETCLFGPGNMAPPLVCLAVKQEKAALYHVRENAREVANYLWINTPALTLVGHNMAYDAAVCMAQWPGLVPHIFEAYAKGRVRDTYIRECLLHIALGVYEGMYDSNGKYQKFSYSLEACAIRHGLTTGLDKGEDGYRMRYGELLDVPLKDWPTRAVEYPLADVTTTEALYLNQEANRLHDLGDALEDEVRQVQAALWLHLAGVWGVHTDPTSVEELARAVDLQTREVRENLVQAGLVRREVLTKLDGERIRALALEEFGDDRLVVQNLVRSKNPLLQAWVAWKKNDCPLSSALLQKEGILEFETKYTRNVKQVQARLRECFGGEVPEKFLTPTGLPQASEEACEAAGDPVLLEYSKYASLAKIASTDLPMLRSGTVTPIHTRYKPLVNTGRTASGDPNIQNINRGIKGLPDIRACFAPRPGYFFADCDYPSLELRTVAQVCLWALGRSKLAEALNAGRDPHLEVAAVILGITYKEAEARKHEKEVKNARNCAKVANFGFPGGLGAKTLVSYAKNGYGVEISLETAYELREQWARAWPEFTDYFAYVNSHFDGDESVIRQFKSKRIRGGVTYTAACNSFFQGLGADCAKDAGFRVARGCYADEKSALYGSRIVLFIHDQLILEVPKDRAHEAAQELAQHMSKASEFWMPDVPAKCEAALMPRWYKNAEPVFAKGKLVPWLPS